ALSLPTPFGDSHQPGLPLPNVMLERSARHIDYWQPPLAMFSTEPRVQLGIKRAHIIFIPLGSLEDKPHGMGRHVLAGLSLVRSPGYPDHVVAQRIQYLFAFVFLVVDDLGQR